MEAWFIEHLLGSGVDVGLIGFLVYLVREVNRLATRVEAETELSAARHQEIIRDLHRIDKKTAVTSSRVSRLEGHGTPHRENESS